MWDEDSAGDQECDRFDQAINVSFATTSTVDSVQFWLNGIRVCIPYDYNYFQDKRGTEGFQGVYFNVNTSRFACVVGMNCDKFNVGVNELLLKVYSYDKMDSIHLTKNSFAQLAYNKAYIAYYQSDSLSALMTYFKRDRFLKIGCKDKICLVERASNSLLCIDSHSDSPEKKFKNTCGIWDDFQY